jgi:hypothetical protein
MPLLPYWAYLGIGALVGGGGVWVATETTKKITTLAVIGGALYLYANRK